MAKYDRVALDEARKLNGQPPMTDDEFNVLENPTNGLSEKEKQAQSDKLKLEQEEAKRKESEGPEGKEPKEKIVVREMNDEELLEVLSQRTGRKVASFEDLSPKEVIDAEKAKEERESDKLTWGFKNKVIKKAEYENYIADSQKPEDLVYRQRLAAAQKEDANLDEKEFRAEFEEEFGLDADASPRRKKNGKDTLTRIASNILSGTYGAILSLEERYSAHEKSVTAEKERQQKVLQGAPAYKKALSDVKGKLSKIKTQFSDEESYEVAPLAESIDRVIEMMQTPEFASQQILNGYTPEQLQDIAYTTVLKENFPLLAQEIAKQHLLKHAAGTKGILKIQATGSGLNDEGLTDEQKKLKGIIEANKKPEPALN